MKKMIKSFLGDESGVETMEYAFVAAAVVLLAAIAYTAGLGTAINGYVTGLLP